jgi:hypothetical protein
VDNRIKVLVAPMPSPLGELVTGLIKNHSDDMDLVESEPADSPGVKQADLEVDTLHQGDWAFHKHVATLKTVLKGARDANIIILPLSQSGRIPAICSRLLEKFPDLVIIVLSRNGDTAFIAARVAQPLREGIETLVRLCTQIRPRLRPG